MKVSEIGTVERVKVADLQPSEQNPRKIPDQAVKIVAESLKRFGWQQPLVVDRNYEVVVGHTRLLAATMLGLTEVPVVVASNLTEAEIKAYRIADNRTHDFSAWDFPELVSQLEELADDFADVLALDDWQAIVAEFEDMTYDIDPEVVTDLAGSGFEIVVVFQDKESGLRAEPTLIDLPGVLDVRHKA